MSNMAVGFNVEQGNLLMSTIAAAYNDLDETIVQEYKGMVEKLRYNWVGEDEQDYEKKLAEKLNGLYVNAYTLVRHCCNTINATLKTWIDFQSTNRILAEGESVVNSHVTETLLGYIKSPEIEEKKEICKFERRTDLTVASSRGLTSTDSAADIKTSINQAKTNIETEIDSLCNIIKEDVQTAFFGGQVDKITEFVTVVQDSIKVVITGFEDMYNAVDALAGTAYSGGEGSIESFVNSSISEQSESTTQRVSSYNKWGN